MADTQAVKTPIPVVLASQSPSRLQLLIKAGIRPTIRISHIDEPAVLEQSARDQGLKVDDIPAQARVMVLATAKAQAIAGTYTAAFSTVQKAEGDLVISRPIEEGFGSLHSIMSVQEAIADNQGLEGLSVGPLVIGSDSLFEMDGQVYGKPHDAATARERLQAMRGSSGTLWTGHCVIDCATGKTAQSVSYGRVNFAQYSDTDIERYIATGEPLEVAGTFTLEGLGSAFIESIQGDPSGVVGLSIPTLRTLVNQLGVEWTDLWNTTLTMTAEQRAAKNSKPSATVHSYKAAEKVPDSNINQPGDGWISCVCGHKHWGLNGAAGVLLLRRDDSGVVTHAALQHRAAWSAEGGTWGIPGGAIADGENAFEGALRESLEEAGMNPADLDIVGAYCEDHGPWAYTTVFAFEKQGVVVDPHATDDESDEVHWVSLDEIRDLNLLSALKQDWAHFVQRFTTIAAKRRY